MKSPNADEKVALFSAKLAMIMIQQKKAEISADRAVYLRNLYFCAGLSPYNITMLRDNISQIAKDVKSAFNKDLVTMLSDIDKPMTYNSVEISGKGWAQKDNWLEEVVQGSKFVANNKQKVGNYNYLQLGAYREKENADKDWKKMSTEIPEIKTFNHKVVVADVYGLTWYRSILEGEINQLEQFCNKIKTQGYDCLLR